MQLFHSRCLLYVRFLAHTHEREELNEMCIQIGGYCMLTHYPL